MIEALGAKIAAGLYVLGYVVGAVEGAPSLAAVLQVGALLLALALAPRYLRNRDLREQLKALEGSIETHEIVKRGDDARIAQLEDELRGAQERGNIAEERARGAEQREVEWKTRCDEMAKVQTGPAFTELKEILIDRERHDKKRHDEILNLIAQLAGEHAVTSPRT